MSDRSKPGSMTPGSMTPESRPARQPEPATEHSRTPRTHRQRIYLALAGLAGGVIVIAVLWVVVTGLMARSRLNAAQDEIPQLRTAVSAGHLGQARTIAARIAAQTGDAHQLTSGPAWWVTSNLPVVGTPFRTGRVVAYQADLIGHDALPGVLRLAGGVERSPRGHGQLDLRPLAAAGTGVARADRTVHRASTAIDATSPSWLPVVSHARASVIPNLRELDGQLYAAHRAVSTLLPMLGAHHRQRYFLGFMNEAESRGLGGIPGAFAIVSADHGRLRFTHFGTDDELRGVRTDVNLGRQYRVLYGQDDPTGIVQNSDISPNFPDAARIWAGMWQAKSGQHVDGAVAIDPSALGYLLGASGPAPLPDGSSARADNVVALTQQGQYARYGGTSRADITARKRYLVSLASAIAHRVLEVRSGHGLGDAAQRAVHERRLMLWSDDPAREATIEHFGLAGVLRPGDHPFSGFVVNNAAGSKLDYYLQTRMSYRRSSCRAGATATARFTLTNDTPRYALPPYVTTVLGSRPRGAKPGFNRVIVTYYATAGSTVRTVRLDGERQIVASAPEDGLTTIRLLVNLPAHATRTLTVTTDEPRARGPVQILRQPSVQPVEVTTQAPRCS